MADYSSVAEVLSFLQNTAALCLTGGCILLIFVYASAAVATSKFQLEWISIAHLSW
jgi:hypothetical protein